MILLVAIGSIVSAILADASRDDGIPLDDDLRLRILEKARERGLRTGGGFCGPTAIALRKVLFAGTGRLVFAVNRPLMEMGRPVGHIALEVGGVLWDGDGPMEDEEALRAWGMLDFADPDWQDAGIDTPEEADDAVLLREDELSRHQADVLWNHMLSCPSGPDMETILYRAAAGMYRDLRMERLMQPAESMTLFHGTTRSRLPGVLRAGIVSSAQGQGKLPLGALLHVTEEDAHRAAWALVRRDTGWPADRQAELETRTGADADGEIVVLRVALPPDRMDRLVAALQNDDGYRGDALDGRRSLRETGAARYQGIVPARWVEIPAGITIPERGYKQLATRVLWEASVEARHPGLLEEVRTGGSLARAALNHGLSTERVRQLQYEDGAWTRRDIATRGGTH